MSTKTAQKPDSLITGEEPIALLPQAPFDFRFSTRYYRARSSLPVGPGESLNENSLTLYDIIEGHPHRIQINSTGSVDRPKLEVTWAAVKSSRSSGNPASARAVATRLKRMFMLDLDLERFYQTFTRDRCVKGLATTFRGLKPVLTPTVFDAAIWAIVGQQINLAFAQTLKNRLAQKYGHKIETQSGHCFLGPGPSHLARARKSSLLKLQLSTRKAEYILGLCQQIDSGKLNLDALCALPYEEALAKLMEIRGIGIWSASYILLRGAGALDALPLGDSGLRRAIETRYKMPARPSAEEITRCAERHRPFRSLYTLYLWRGLG